MDEERLVDTVKPASFFCQTCDAEVDGFVETLIHAPQVAEERHFHYPPGWDTNRRKAHETDWEQIEPDENEVYDRHRDDQITDMANEAENRSQRVAPRSKIVEGDYDPGYREAMIDSGRGRLLR